MGFSWASVSLAGEIHPSRAGVVTLPYFCGDVLMWSGLSIGGFPWSVAWSPGMRGRRGLGLEQDNMLVRAWRRLLRLGWRPGPRVSTTRQGVVDWRTATLMYAGRDRRSATRRKVPLTKRAPAWPSHSTGGDRSCSGGAPARRAPASHPGAEQGDRWSGHVRPPASPPTGTRRAPERSPSPPRWWSPCARPAAGSGHTSAAAPPTPAQRPRDPAPAGAHAGRRRPPGGAGRPRPTPPAGREDGRCRSW